MADEHKTPSWVPDWFPKFHSLDYSAKMIQLGILILAASYLLYHLFQGKVSKVASTAAGAAS